MEKKEKKRSKVEKYALRGEIDFNKKFELEKWNKKKEKRLKAIKTKAEEERKRDS